MQNIWYPGSSYADKKWIEYLQNNYSGNWLFSDINEFSDWLNLPGERKIFDTFNFNKLNAKIDILIISRHSGMRTSEEVINSKILDHINPQKFIYDPGTNIGEIEEHLKASKLFSNLGYNIKQIVLLHSLYHQICEFEKV
jgi:hypothetical protein